MTPLILTAIISAALGAWAGGVRQKNIAADEQSERESWWNAKLRQRDKAHYEDMQAMHATQLALDAKYNTWFERARAEIRKEQEKP